MRIQDSNAQQRALVVSDNNQVLEIQIRVRMKFISKVEFYKFM